MTDNLRGIRARIDEIDERLADLLRERRRLAVAAATDRAWRHAPPRDPDRERAVVESQRFRCGYPQETVEAIYRALFEAPIEPGVPKVGE